MGRRAGLALLSIALVASACSSDDDDAASTAAATVSAAPETSAPSETTTPTTAPPMTTEPSTTPPPTVPVTSGPPPSTAPASTAPTTSVPGGAPLETRQLVEALAADELTGRDNGTPGSAAAQQLLSEQLAQFAQPVDPTRAGLDGFRQEFPAGINLLGVIPGGDLAEEWVVLGAHYDHLGSDCRSSDPADAICNGATDNATGVAVALAAARAIAEAGTPRRSVLVALWDAEEDGLVGSAAYVQSPVAPPEQTIAYINFDNMGSNLLPSGTNRTVVVGAETGGAPLVDATTAAAATSTLLYTPLSLVFGQGRSDHAVFASAGVPVVFFTDATGPCYHTTGDDVGVVDFAKLDQQIVTATALLGDLAATDIPPVFDPTAPLTTYEDALAMLDVVTSARPHFSRFDPAAQAASEQYVADLEAIAAAGPDAFDDAAIGTLLGGAVTFVDALTTGECDGFLS
jgi:Peptidase family M28